MSLSYCIAARGHPGLLQVAAGLTATRARRDDTRVVIALDDDDAETIAAAEQVKRFAGDRILLSIAPREDTLGAKYNRAWRAHAADLYVIGCDDTAAATEGWDELLDRAWRSFPDGIGAVYFGDLDNVFQAGQAVTHRLAAELGYFVAAHFPTWWHDSWLDEIARMLDRIVRAPVALTAIGPIGHTRGLRDIVFWATIYDITRFERRAAAERIVRDQQFLATPESKAVLLAMMAKRCLEFNTRCAHFRDRATVDRFESGMGYDAPDDARYRRAMRAAVEHARYIVGASW